MLRLSPPCSSISPSGADPERIRALEKKRLAVKSWPLPERLTNVSVTGLPAARWIGLGEQLKLISEMTWPAGWAAAGAKSSSDMTPAAAIRDANIGTSLFSPERPD